MRKLVGVTALLLAVAAPLLAQNGGKIKIVKLYLSGDRIIGLDNEASKLYVSNDAGATWITVPDLAGLIQSEHVTLTAGVPTLWLGLLALLDKENHLLWHWPRRHRSPIRWAPTTSAATCSRGSSSARGSRWRWA